MDPIASLSPRPVDVELDGWIYTIPALPADRWLEAVLEGSVAAVVPGLLGGEDYNDVMHRWLVGEINDELVQRVAREALGAAAGREWWKAERLIRSACDEDNWVAIHGNFIRHGTRMDSISLGAFCDAVWSLILQYATEEQRHELEFSLNLPPSSVDLDELYDEDSETERFEADLAELGTGG